MVRVGTARWLETRCVRLHPLSFYLLTPFAFFSALPQVFCGEQDDEGGGKMLEQSKEQHLGEPCPS